jgi:putative ABC transport system permease protein
MAQTKQGLSYFQELQLAFKFALREMRGGLRGFYIFIACIALGVGAISGVNSVSQAISDGLKNEGQAILGGDFSLSVLYRDFNEKEKEVIESYGEYTELTSLRAMARLEDGSDQTLVEVKAIDQHYPLYGKLKLSNNVTLKDGQVAVGQTLLERLNLQVGDQFMLGDMSIKIVALIENEPDKVSEGIGFGPKILMTDATLKKTKLLQPGALNTHHIRVKLSDQSQAVSTVVNELKEAFPDHDWRIRTHDNAAPSLQRNLLRFSQFLTLVGLAALIVGGVGVANAVGSYLTKKQTVIASFKCLGASNSFVFWLYLIQIIMLALIGVGLGLIIGMVMPWLASMGLAAVVPIGNTLAFYPGALLLGAVYGLLVALIFAIWVLARARQIPPTQLLRASRGSLKTWPSAQYLFSVLVLSALLIGLILFFSKQQFIAVTFIGAMLVAFVLLRLVGIAIEWMMARLPRSKSTALRMAVANIHRPGSLTKSVVLSLGLGLALLVSLSLIDGNLRQQVSSNIPEQAPDFFFVDVQDKQLQEFTGFLKSAVDDATIQSVPMLRGRITQLRGIDANDYKAADGGEWVLRGDRGITYSATVPENSTLSEGEWWPKGYAGEPLVSFSAEEAGELGLKLGDEIEVNVLGRKISAKIASLRQVEWQSLGINFVMVFSPNTFAGAPHSHVATLQAKGEQSVSDGEILGKVTKRFPNVTSVRVRDALTVVNQLIGQMATAIRAAASVALIASVLVLAGALAAGHETRTYDSVVLKMLGATRRLLIKGFVIEFLILGLVTGIFALMAGGLISWFVMSQIMGFEANFIWSVALTTLGIAISLSIGFGLMGSWRALGQKPASILREVE